MKLSRYILLLISAVLITACGDDDNAEPPAELTEFKATYFLSLDWSVSTDDSIEQKYLFIEPLLLKDRIVTAGRNGTLNAYDLEDGDELAEIELDTPLSGGIGGNENTWLVGSRNGVLSGVLGSHGGRPGAASECQETGYDADDRPCDRGVHAMVLI